jgi:hypothetical protein
MELADEVAALNVPSKVWYVRILFAIARALAKRYVVSVHDRHLATGVRSNAGRLWSTLPGFAQVSLDIAHDRVE